jgi:hypothetical protein
MAPELAGPANRTAMSVSGVRTTVTSSFLRNHPTGATTLPLHHPRKAPAHRRFRFSHDTSGCPITNGVTADRRHHFFAYCSEPRKCSETYGSSPSTQRSCGSARLARRTSHVARLAHCTLHAARRT